MEIINENNIFELLLKNCNITNAENENENENTNEKSEVPIYIRLLCNWTDSDSLTKLWNKMSQNGSGKWNKLQTLCENIDPDYYIVINALRQEDIIKYHPEPKKIILFHMEPKMEQYPNMWGAFANPDANLFFKVFTHKNSFNNTEWHLSKTFSELVDSNYSLNKTKTLSTVLSRKCRNPGQRRRIFFVKYIENAIPIDVYGDNHFSYKNYVKQLPYHEKDEALIPYKYTFNAENHSYENYITEKLIDGVLAECLTFYYGAPNACEFIDKRAFIQLNLSNLDKSGFIVQSSINNNEWEKRIEIIRKEKQKILFYHNMFARIERVVGI
jgi:hypothetical protein